MNNIGDSTFVDILLNNEYIKRSGWIRSLIEKQVIDASGDPIPWYAYPAIDLLKDRISIENGINISVFEFGYGFGTLWWASKVHKVTIVEHDRAWYNKMVPQFPPNVRPIYRELVSGGEYCSITKSLLPIKYNIIIIDGRDRVNCCHHCINSLTDDGVIIFDNSNREAYIPGREFLKKYGFKELRLYGFTPMVPIAENATSFFYKKNNCLGF